MMAIICFVVGIIAGAIGIYYVFRGDLKERQSLDLATKQQNEQYKKELIELTEEYATLTTKNNALKEHIETSRQQAEHFIQNIYDKGFELMGEKLSAAADRLSKDYEQSEKSYIEEYENIMAEYSKQFFAETQQKQLELQKINDQLKEFRAKVSAAVEAAKRQEEINTKQNFYKLNLSDIDLEEIKQLREVTKFLRNSEPINKVIWKVYYEKPYTDLVGRLIGENVVTGIYKITNIENQKCYVGQAVNIAERFRQHIKRGVGAEAPTKNKLYPAMMKYGVENFTFEIIEKCPREDLNNREDYWQSYFGAKEFGYSIK